MKKYDIIIIGSGGGAKLSVPAANLGYKVAMIEKHKMGGTCLNRGCIPSKMLIYPSEVAQIIRDSKKFDINAKINNITFANLTKRISKTVDTDERAIRKSYRGVTNPKLYHGEAKFVSDKIIEVNGEKLTAKYIFIATGARPFIPPIPGLKGTPYMTSTEALRNTKKIKKLIVVGGGGFIGAELGTAYSQLGTDVHFLVRDQFLCREDLDIIEEFTKEFKKNHNVYQPVLTEKVSYKNKKFTVTIKYKSGKRKKLTSDGLLVTTGVCPNSDSLGLENTKIRTNKRGFIETNHYGETGVRGVYAIGDVAGKYLFRHSVNFEGEFLLENLLKKGKRKPIAYPPMPHAVFTNPEIASVGVTEQELIEKKVPYVASKNKYMQSAMGMARLSDHGFVKLLFHRKTKRLIGAHIIGEDAATMIHQLIYAMTFNATVDDLLRMIYIHPALPEIVRNAARKAKVQF